MVVWDSGGVQPGKDPRQTEEWRFLHKSTSEGRDRKEFLTDDIFLNQFVLPKLPHDNQRKPDKGRKGK